MATAGGPEFEPVFGSRGTSKPLEPRLRDRRSRAEQDPNADEPADPDHTTTEDPQDAGSVGELVDIVEAHRTVGDDTKPFSKPGQVAGEPMLVDGLDLSDGSAERAQASGADGGPVIPAEILDAQARSAEARVDVVSSDSTGNPQRVGSR